MDLPTTHLGTTCCPGFRYIMPFTEMKYIILTYIGLSYYMENWTSVHHGKREKGTTAHTGVWYIMEYWMKVHQLRLDEGTSQKTVECYINEDRI